MDGNPALGLLGFWMMMQLAATIALLLGGIYALFCLGRAAAGLDRMASAIEEWVAKQNAASTPILPGNTPPTPLSQRMDLPAQATSTPVPRTPVTSAPVPSDPPGHTPLSAPVSPIAQPPVNQPPASASSPAIRAEYSRPDESTA